MRLAWPLALAPRLSGRYPAAMRVYRDHRGLLPQDQGASAAIGNFDGVHLGHRAIIDIARRPQVPLGVVTFEPHPRQFFAAEDPPFRLMNAAARAHRLEKLGVERLYELRFDAELAALTPDAFVERVLVGGLGLSHAVIGTDFRFGKGRAGTAADLARRGGELGMEVTVADLVDLGGVEVSSTRIRAALSEGRPADAAALLGHLHRIEGQVLGGERRGRELGYPTANISIDGLHPPRFGVYAVEVDVLDGASKGRYRGVASLGVRPMFGENKPNLETFLFDFSGDLYGATLSVALVAYLRSEERFDSLGALIAQMDADSARARGILEARP